MNKHCLKIWFCVCIIVQRSAFILAATNPAINATTNVAALAITATAKSVYKGNVARHLIDGNTNSSLDSGTCASTNVDGSNGDAYFRIHLDDYYDIGQVVVYNRLDCCSNRSDCLVVGLANSSGLGNSINLGSYPLCGVYPGSALNVPVLTIDCDPNVGPVNNIIIQSSCSIDGVLNLCEVMAFVKIDGNWGSWSSWSVSTATCGGNTTVSRTRMCDSPSPANNGNGCQGNYIENKTVALPPCPINSNWNAWSAWSAPSITCGGTPIQTRTRTCNNTAQFGGQTCLGSNTETKTLPVKPPCPINGNWGVWSEWSVPSVSCGGYPTQTRTRICNNPVPQFNGATCPGGGTENRTINIINPCPIIGYWSDWSNWIGPIYVCGPPQEIIRTRTCYSLAANNSAPSCVGNSTEKSKNSLVTITCPINGGWGNWGPWGQISLTCDGVPTSTRTRSCDNPPPQFNGSSCAGPDTDLYILPEAPPCPINTIWGDWGSWSSNPSLTCGTFPVFLIRERNCLLRNGTQNIVTNTSLCEGCSVDVNKKVLPKCKIDGKWGAWSSWQLLSITCSNTVVNVIRTRACNNPEPSDGGSFCIGSKEESKAVILPSCKINGKWSPWGSFSEISMTCGNVPAVKTRKRTCTNPAPSGGGSPCPGSATDSFNIDVPRCDDKGWSNWNEWINPTHTCGDSPAFRTRTRVCQNKAKVQGGYDCIGDGIETQLVNLPACELESGCPAEFIYNKENGKCYYLITVLQNWEDQRNFCNGIHQAAHLVTPTNHQDFEDISDFLYTIDYQITSKCSDKATGTTLLWTAGQKEGDKFVWKPFKQGEVDPYFPIETSVWVPGAPDNFCNLENCVHLVKTDEGYRLNDISCSATNNLNYNKKYKNFDKMCGVCEVKLNY